MSYSKLDRMSCEALRLRLKTHIDSEQACTSPFRIWLWKSSLNCWTR